MPWGLTWRKQFVLECEADTEVRGGTVTQLLSLSLICR